MNTNKKKEIGKNLFVCIRVHSWPKMFSVPAVTDITGTVAAEMADKLS